MQRSHEPSPPCLREIFPDLLIHADGTNVGVLRQGSAALLVNAGNEGLAAALREAGVERVDRVLFTHHRRELADGLDEVAAAFRPEVGVPEAEEAAFADPDAYWSEPASRWRVLSVRLPYHATHVRAIPPAATFEDGDVIEWGDWTITVLSTPGYTDGSVTYLVRKGDRSAAFTGDLIYGPGMVRDLYCLQRADEKNGHRVGGYHGFMGSMEELVASLEKARCLNADVLVPAHGEVMDRPEDAIRLLIARLRTAYHNYANVSALRWYMPKYFASHSVTAKTLPMQETFPRPPGVRRLLGTVWALVAESRRAILIDPCAEQALDEAQKLMDAGEIEGFDGIWITHYHTDHMAFAEVARTRYDCPVMTDRILADVLENPGAYLLTCMLAKPTKVARPTHDGETWKWENFTLTAHHFPGQTYYHSGLLAVSDAGERYFFSGDSFTPTGIDDYCSWNRNFLGQGVGFEHCVDLVRRLRPDLIFNQHVEFGFRFTEEAWELVLANLRARRRLFVDLLPWDDPNFGTDERWVSAYPYEQSARPGETVDLQVRVLNHSADARAAAVAVDVPDGWGAAPARLEAVCPGKREARLNLAVTVPADAAPGRTVLPIRIVFGGLNLGSFGEAIVEVV